jgi:hypothetical protein
VLSPSETLRVVDDRRCCDSPDLFDLSGHQTAEGDAKHMLFRCPSGLHEGLMQRPVDGMVGIAAKYDLTAQRRLTANELR